MMNISSPTSEISDCISRSKPKLFGGFLPTSSIEMLCSAFLNAAIDRRAFAYGYHLGQRSIPTEKPTIFDVTDVSNSLNAFSHFQRAKDRFTLFYDDLDLACETLKTLHDSIDLGIAYRKLNVAGSLSSFDSSVGYHSDDKDVLLIQLQGQRHWKVWSRSALNKRELVDVSSNQNLIPYIEFNPIIPPEMDITLQPGDAIVIPSCCPHLGVTSTGNAQPSISISFSWYSISPLTILSKIRNHAPFHETDDQTLDKLVQISWPFEDLFGAEYENVALKWHASLLKLDLFQCFPPDLLLEYCREILINISTHRRIFLDRPR